MSAPSEHAAHAIEVRGEVSSAKLGLWLFLLTELILFGGLFILYASYRFAHAAAFAAASTELSLLFGTENTIILITSSLTVALAILSLEKGGKRAAIALLSVTIALGLAFLVNKGLEWTEEIGRGFYPNSPILAGMDRGEVLFFGLYYSMTGLHALHIMIGLGVLATVLASVARGKVRQGRTAFLENAGLYWHLVDVIWIFLFPLFYLISGGAL
jgi:cytochrome c oxidase subunit 3